MTQITDKQIFDLIQIKTLPVVSIVSISVGLDQGSKYCSICVYGTMDADMVPVVEVVEQIIPGIEIQLLDIQEKENGETLQMFKYFGQKFSLLIYSRQTFDDVKKIPA